LVNKKEQLFKAMCSNGNQYAILCRSDLGPCFGADGDYIKDICLTTKAQNILAGSPYFETLEIEVYAKSN